MIETSRLMLRPFTPQDESAIIIYLMNPEFMVYSPTGTLNLNEARQRFLELMESYQGNGLGKFAVTIKSSGVLIGYCGIEMCEMEGAIKPELGFRIHKNHRGMGYATEAAAAVLEQEQSLSGRVIAFTEPSNEPSIKVLKKLGFKCTGDSSFRGMTVAIFNRVSR